jgi:hypothetical protein
MPTFDICGTVTISCWTKVNAKTKEEALAIARSRDLAEFHIDGSFDVEECWHMEADGVPTELRVDE